MIAGPGSKNAVHRAPEKIEKAKLINHIISQFFGRILLFYIFSRLANL